MPESLARGITVWLLDPATYGPSRRFPGEWKVEKINPRRVKVSQPRDGGGVGIVNADKALISLTPPAGRATEIEFRAPWPQGKVVRWKTAPPKAGGELFVIIKDDGLPTIARMVQLGNTTGRYWLRIPAAELEAVSLDDILRPEVRR